MRKNGMKKPAAECIVFAIYIVSALVLFMLAMSQK